MVILVFLLGSFGLIVSGSGYPEDRVGPSGEMQSSELSDALANAFPEVQVGWNRLVEPLRQGYQCKVYFKIERPSDGKKPIERELIEGLLPKADGVLVRNVKTDTIDVYGPEMRFKVRRAEPGTDGPWYLADVPQGFDPTDIKREFARRLSFGSPEPGDDSVDTSVKSVSRNIPTFAFDVFAPFTSLPRIPEEGNVSFEKSEIVENGQTLWRIDYTITGPATDPSFVGGQGLIVLDPSHDFRPLRWEFTTSTGKTKNLAQFQYDDEGITSYEVVFDDCRRESNTDDWRHNRHSPWTIKRVGDAPPEEEFQLEHYGIKTGVPRRRFGWSTILITAGILIVFIGGWGYVRQNRTT